MEISLFSKYKDMKVVPTGSLLELDFRIATQKHACPYCGLKLYEIIGANRMRCKSIKCPNRVQNGKTFTISKSKMR